MKNYKLILKYDGTRYRGWQRQGNTPDTIQARMETLLSRLLDQPIEVAGSGRTDAGVHARAQVCSFHAEEIADLPECLEMIRVHLPEDIGAISLEEVSPRFHARLSAVEKTYLYRLWISDEPCVFERRYVWSPEEKPDIAAMKEASVLLCGEHDYASFTTSRGKKSTVRNVKEIRFEEKGPELRLWFVGNGFLYNMVRILTGTLVEVGLHRRSPESIPELFEEHDRSKSGFTAPAKGLTLWEVRY